MLRFLFTPTKGNDQKQRLEIAGTGRDVARGSHFDETHGREGNRLMGKTIFKRCEDLAKKLGLDIDPPGSQAAAETLYEHLSAEYREHQHKKFDATRTAAIENKILLDREKAGREVPLCDRCTNRLPPGQGRGYCPECKELRAQGKIPGRRRKPTSLHSIKCDGKGCKVTFQSATASAKYCDSCKDDPMKRRTTEEKLAVIDAIDRLRQTMETPKAVATYNEQHGDTVGYKQYLDWRAGRKMGMKDGNQKKGNAKKAKAVKGKHDGKRAKKYSRRLETARGVAALCLERNLTAADGVTEYLKANPSAEKISEGGFNTYRKTLTTDVQEKLCFLFRSLGRPKGARPNTGIGRYTPEEKMAHSLGIAQLCIDQEVSQNVGLERYFKQHPDLVPFSSWTFHECRKKFPQELQDKLVENTSKLMGVSTLAAKRQQAGRNAPEPGKYAYKITEEKLELTRKIAELSLERAIKPNDAVAAYNSENPPPHLTLSAFKNVRGKLDPATRKKLNKLSYALLKAERGNGPMPEPPATAQPEAPKVPSVDEERTIRHNGKSIKDLALQTSVDQALVLTAIANAGTDFLIEIQDAISQRKATLHQIIMDNIQLQAKQLIALGTVSAEDAAEIPGLLDSNFQVVEV